MEDLHNCDTVVLIASHLEPVYRELDPPYLEICAVLRNGLVHGYQHYVEPYSGLVAHPESLSEIIILLGAGPFFNNKNQVVTYNHDTILEAMLPKLSIMPCWIKRGYWSQSTNMPLNVRGLATIEETEAAE